MNNDIFLKEGMLERFLDLVWRYYNRPRAEGWGGTFV